MKPKPKTEIMCMSMYIRDLNTSVFDPRVVGGWKFSHYGVESEGEVILYKVVPVENDEPDDAKP